MAGFPLTAWALRHPGGDHADAVLDALREGTVVPREQPVPAEAIATALLGELAPQCATALERWGSSRVAVVLGSADPTRAQPLVHLSQILGLVRDRTAIVGPAYHVAAHGAGGARALASAERLLRASLADAVLAGGIDEDQGALVLVEKHGDAFVRLSASAEATSIPPREGIDESAGQRAIAKAWALIGQAPLGYAHLQAGSDEPAQAAAERRIVQAVCGDVPTCTTAPIVRSEGAVAGAIEAVLAAASLVRGYTPEPAREKLEHDRVLAHAYSGGGHHVALLLEASS